MVLCIFLGVCDILLHSVSHSRKKLVAAGAQKAVQKEPLSNGIVTHILVHLI